MKSVIPIALFMLFLPLLNSCKSTSTTNYRAYEKPFETAPARAARKFLLKLPNNEGFFYGNYGGLGSNGGCPTDEMDELFRRHDIVYTEAKTWKMIRTSDEELTKYLEKIPDSCLDQEGITFRDKAIKFFNNPISKIVSKPCASFIHFKEPVDSPFPDEQSVICFFSPENPGFPAE